MKRALFAFTALLTTTAVVFVVALATILPTTEKVTFSANPQYLVGDPANVQGLQLVAETQMDGQLHWTTTFTPAQSPNCESQFRFTPQSEPVFYTPSTTNPQLTITSFISVTVIKGDVFDYRSASYPAYREMVQDVASRAPVQGGSYTETVVLRDYMDFYPISVEISDWALEGYSFYETVDLSSVFPIPIPGNLTAEITVTVQPDGTISGFSFYAPEMPYITAKAVYFQDAFYVPFPYDVMDLDLDDTAVTPGLYRLPLIRTEDDAGMVDVSGVELVAPMDAPAQAMAITGNGQQLALVTSATDSHPNRLTLIDLATGTQRQQFDLDNTNWVMAFYAADDHIVYMGTHRTQQGQLGQSTVKAWRLEEDGTFSPFLSTTVPDNMPSYGGSSITSILRGDTLYTLSYPSSGPPTYITLVVYDPQGCRYAADLTMSQNQDADATLHPITLTDLRLEFTSPD